MAYTFWACWWWIHRVVTPLRSPDGERIHRACWAPSKFAPPRLALVLLGSSEIPPSSVQVKRGAAPASSALRPPLRLRRSGPLSFAHLQLRAAGNRRAPPPSGASPLWPPPASSAPPPAPALCRPAPSGSGSSCPLCLRRSHALPSPSLPPTLLAGEQASCVPGHLINSGRLWLKEMAPTLKRPKRKHLQPEEEGYGGEEVTSSEEEEECEEDISEDESEEEEEEDDEDLSKDESEKADSEHDVKEDGDSDDVEGGDDEDVSEAEGTGGLRQDVSGGGEELEELEKEYQTLQQQEQSLLSNLKRQRDEDRIKGQAIKNQKALWNRNLVFRFLLQKAFAKSNKLPQEPLRSKFYDHDKTVENAYSELILSSEKTLDSMLQLQEVLLEKNSSISQDKDVASNKFEFGNDDKWFQIQSMQCRIASFRNSSIDKWQRKTQVTSGAAAIKGKLHAFNQNISDQVAAYMRDPSRMIGRMQLKRSAVGILGESPEEIVTESKEDGNVELTSMDGDPELIDDSEFYQQLLKEFFESFDVASEPGFSALRKSQTRKRKTVDRRASKSRKIRYNVHEKIVNFMAPLPMVLPPMAPKLFENLFGLQKKESATTM